MNHRVSIECRGFVGQGYLYQILVDNRELAGFLSHPAAGVAELLEQGASALRKQEEIARYESPHHGN